MNTTKKTTTLILALLLVVTAAVGIGVAQGERGFTASNTAPDFTLPDTNGNQQTFSALRGKEGTVLIFMSTKCPVSNAYNERMEKLARDYQARGVNVVGINSNKTETVADIKAFASEKGFTFPVLKDNGNVVADKLNAQVTPEAFFYDKNNNLVYKGRIDNSQKPDSVTADDLRTALDETLAGKKVTTATARAFGCSIKRAS